MEYREKIHQRLIEEHWLNKLSGVEPSGDVSLRDREAGTPHAYAVSLAAAELGFINHLTRGNNIGAFTIYLTLYGILLKRYFRCRHVIVASPSINCENVEPGHNLILHKLQLGEDKTLKEAIKLVQAEIQSTYNYSNYSFDELRNLLTGNGIAEQELLHFGFFFQPLHADRLAFDRNVGLRFYFEPKPDNGVTLQIVAAARFEEGMVKSLLDHFRLFLAEVSASLDRPLQGTDILSGDEKARLRNAFNGPRYAFPEGRTIHELFESQVRKTPHATAVHHHGTCLTYAQLNERSNRVADHLRTHHAVGRNDLVGLVLNKSELMLVGILGILKAGGAYVPVNPGNPWQRISQIVSNAGLALILTSTDCLGSVQAYTGAVVLLDDENAFRNASPDDPRPASTAADLAYCIYTSGSTGLPKGVMIDHESVVNLVAGLHACLYHKHPGPRRVSLLSAFVFDASVQQIFGALLNGHELVLIPDEVKQDGKMLWDFLVDRNVEIVDGTPSHLNMLLGARPGAVRPLPVQDFLIGGEALPKLTAANFCALLRENNSAATITNVYGPTECCVDVTYFRVEEAAQLSRYHSVPIGRPMANREIYVVDEYLRLTPVGVIGEICIAGVGISKGYCNQPELTREKFVPNPFNADYPVLYKTGDYGRWLEDGNVEYLGRIDKQVKVRGYRIELAEIEGCLLQVPHISQVVVTVREDHDKELKYLVAYVKSDEPQDPYPLREALRRMLP
ncbi:MAG: amino acid adenylation domain-containing protein, partial [Cytophagales bacterium]|nr:amino acid adenylation domain-containing protein [Cytophagales bacterium]